MRRASSRVPGDGGQNPQGIDASPQGIASVLQAFGRNVEGAAASSAQAAGCPRRPQGREGNEESGSGRRDRVLLLGPSRFACSPGSRAALLAAGWTHLVRVDEINGAASPVDEIDRDDTIFTKFRALELPYKRILLLDLDLHLRVDPKALFAVPAPAGKFHDPNNCWPHRARHGLPFKGNLPDEALLPGIWCASGGVLRFDPELDRVERHEQVLAIERDAADHWRSRSFLSATMQHEQYYLAENLGYGPHQWHHIDGCYNVESIEFGRAGVLDSALVLHFSGKYGFTEPTTWLDAEPAEFGVAVATWHEMHRGLLERSMTVPSGPMMARAFAEWRGVFEKLRADAAAAWPPNAREALEEAARAVAQRAPTERDQALRSLAQECSRIRRSRD